MHVMHKAYVIAKFGTQSFKHADGSCDVARCTEDGGWRDTLWPQGLRLRGSSGPCNPIARPSRHAQLHPDDLITLLNVGLNLIVQLALCHGRSMAIELHRCTYLSTQQLIDRNSQAFPQDVPQCPIDAAEGVISLRSRSEVLLHVRRLPDVIDLVGILANDKR